VSVNADAGDPKGAASDGSQSAYAHELLFGAMAAAGGVPGELKVDELLKDVNAQLFGPMCEIVAAAFRGNAAAAAARETVEAAFREVRPEFAAAVRDPERSDVSSKTHTSGDNPG